MPPLRDFFSPGRSPVSGRDSAVVSSHALASGAALTVLAEGGNAVDAAVTATFVQGVVEPQSTGIGGDCFALLFKKGSERPIGLNGSGRSPAGLDPMAAQASGGAPLAETSVHAVTIPGAVDGLARLLSEHGTWPLERVLAPAIRFAEDGFVVHARAAEEWGFVTAKLAATPEARDALLKDGRAPAAGEVWRLPALGATLRGIARGGADYFYRGRVARDMAAFLKEKGGYHTPQDFAAHRSETVEPVSVSYRGFDVWQIPPNGQGLTTLLMLNLLERSDLSGLAFDGAERHHLIAEAAYKAFARRDRLIGDPAFSPADVEAFTDKTKAAALGARSASCPGKHAAAPARGDTAFVGVVDREGTAVSLITSLFEGFGSGLYHPGSGVVFHNRGSGFSAEPDHPNALAPAKRALHTIIPGMVSRGGRPVLCLGVTGGAYQPTGQVQLITAMIDHQLDIQDAIDRPRSFPVDGKLQLEPSLMPLAEELARRGHQVSAATRAVGGAHAIAIDHERGTLTGGSDPRKDGAALAL